MKASEWIGVVGCAIAGFFWFLSRWAHEILRCLRSGEDSAVTERCAPIIEWPMVVFHSWIEIVAVSALWGVYLIFTGRRRSGGLAVCSALVVVVLALSFM